MARLDMSPLSAVNNPRNLVGPNAESNSKFGSVGFPGRRSTPNLNYVGGGEFRGACLLATTYTGWGGATAQPAFPLSIVSIIGVRAEPQVVWPNARRYVAAMANEQSIGDRTVCQLPSDPMGTRQRAALKTRHTIALVSSRSCPQPAIPAFIHLRPEAGYQFLFRRAHTGTRLATEPCRPSIRNVRQHEKRLLTCLADAFNPGRLLAHHTSFRAGATPPAVSSSAVALSCPNYTREGA